MVIRTGNWRMIVTSSTYFLFTGEPQAKEDQVQDFQFNGELFEEEEKPVALHSILLMIELKYRNLQTE